MKRRALLTSLGVAGSSGLAGCSALDLGGESTPTEQPVRYPALKATPLYLGPAITESLPEYAVVTDDPEAAIVAVVSHETPLDPSKLVDWLLAGVAVGTVERPAMEELIELLVAGNVTESFEGGVLGTSGPVDVAVVEPLDGRLVSYLATYSGSNPNGTGPRDVSLAYMVDDIIENLYTYQPTTGVRGAV